MVVGQPEQAPLAWYYLPRGLRYASTAGPVADPSVTNWMGAMSRLQDANPRATLGPLVASLKPGQQLLYVRPLTEGAKNWKAAWPALVRRRSAQWGQLLQDDRGQRNPQAGGHGPAQLPKRLLRGRQRSALPEGLLKADET